MSSIAFLKMAIRAAEQGEFRECMQAINGFALAEKDRLMTKEFLLQSGQGCPDPEKPERYALLQELNEKIQRRRKGIGQV